MFIGSYSIHYLHDGGFIEAYSPVALPITYTNARVDQNESFCITPLTGGGGGGLAINEPARLGLSNTTAGILYDIATVFFTNTVLNTNLKKKNMVKDLIQDEIKADLYIPRDRFDP